MEEITIKCRKGVKRFVPSLDIVPRFIKIRCEKKSFKFSILYCSNQLFNVSVIDGDASIELYEWVNILSAMNIPLSSWKMTWEIDNACYVVVEFEIIIEGDIVPDSFVKRRKEKLKHTHRFVKHIDFTYEDDIKSMSCSQYEKY